MRVEPNDDLIKRVTIAAITEKCGPPTRVDDKGRRLYSRVGYITEDEVSISRLFTCPGEPKSPHTAGVHAASATQPDDFAKKEREAVRQDHAADASSPQPPSASAPHQPPETGFPKSVSEVAAGLRWSPNLEFDPKFVYMQTMELGGGFATHYSSCWFLKGTIANNTAFPLQLGETVVLLEEAANGQSFAAGCDQRDGILDHDHVEAIEHRYLLDGHEWFSRTGHRRLSPLVGGSCSGMSAADDGMFQRVVLFEPANLLWPGPTKATASGTSSPRKACSFQGAC